VARQQREASDCGETSGTWELTPSTRHEQGRSHVGRSCCQQGLCQAGLVANDGKGQEGGALVRMQRPELRKMELMAMMQWQGTRKKACGG